MPYILGVDPGTTSLGWAIIDSSTLELISSGCFFLRYRRELQGNDALLASEMWRFWVETILKQPARPNCIIVEQNAMNRLYSNVEMCILSYAVGSGMDVAAVHPMTWKSILGIKPTGKHKQNKLASLEYVRELGYNVPTDHQADAICLALCGCQSQ